MEQQNANNSAAKIIVPNQFFGIGDIIWEQTLVKRIAGDRNILWPVLPQFVEGLNRAYPEITFINYNYLNIDYNRRDRYIADGMDILPLRFADSIMKVPYSDCMKSKYMLFDMDWQEWNDDALWFMDDKQQQQLFELLGLSQTEPYNLINTVFGSEGNLNANIPYPENGYKNVIMRNIPGFSLFDWTKVITRAHEIHTVSTSIIYLLEQLHLNAKEVHLYPRKPHEHDFRNVEYILNRHDYIKHQ